MIDMRTSAGCGGFLKLATLLPFRANCKSRIFNRLNLCQIATSPSSPTDGSSNGISPIRLGLSPIDIHDERRNSSSLLLDKPCRHQRKLLSIEFDFTHANASHRHHPRQTSASTHRDLGGTIRPAIRLVRNSINHEYIYEFRISCRSQLVRQFLRGTPSRLRNADVEQRPLHARSHCLSRPMEAHARHASSIHCAADRVELCVLLRHVYAELGTKRVHRNWGHHVQAPERDQIGRFLCESRGQVRTGGVLDDGSTF